MAFGHFILGTNVSEYDQSPEREANSFHLTQEPGCSEVGSKWAAKARPAEPAIAAIPDVGASRDLARPTRMMNTLGTMNLPAPSARLASCVWLPRILAKARLLQRNELPPEYAERFCHPTGVDHQFLSHFRLRREDIVAAASQGDEEVAAWFLARPEGSTESIARWNDIALNMGRPGYPLADRFAVAKATIYKNVDATGMTTVFEILEADDRLS